MRWVVDASSLVAYLLGEGSESERDGMLDDVHAPDLIDVEVTQTLRGLGRGSRIDLATADHGRLELGQLGVRRHPDARLLDRAWELRDVGTTWVNGAGHAGYCWATSVDRASPCDQPFERQPLYGRKPPNSEVVSRLAKPTRVQPVGGKSGPGICCVTGPVGESKLIEALSDTRPA